jgi:hypothetical protein
MGFKPTGFDCNVWIRKKENREGYNYITTYIDDFLIIAKDAWKYVKELQKMYSIKDPQVSNVYLGGIYTGNPGGPWMHNH